MNSNVILPVADCSAQPHQRLFASVVLAAIDDAIFDQEKHGDGISRIDRWARSQDGQTVLRCAGTEPSQRCVDGLIDCVRRGVKTSVALTKTEFRTSFL